jgi:hypothetical protein
MISDSFSLASRAALAGDGRGVLFLRSAAVKRYDQQSAACR